jgi:radical SAM family uncharacterized protein/radical SAM-linked protein
MLRTYREAYERLLPLVEKPTRYLGNERGAVRKSPDAVAVRVALAFPEVYEIAQSHLGLQILYEILNARPDVAAERAYAAWPDLEALLRARGLPLVSLESHLPLADFHVVGFSLQYELTYTNLLTMLELGGIPLRAADRTPAHPLVIAGGPCAFNPEPLAPFLDAVVLGDGEQAVLDVVEVVRTWDCRDRKDVLRALAGIAGVYVPSFFTPRYDADGTLAAVEPLPGAPATVRKRILPDLDTFAPPADPIVPNLKVVHDRAAVEVMRGCVKGCRFCQAGYIYRPLRERDPERVVARTIELMARTGYEEVSLLSLSTGDYSGVNPVLKGLMDRLAPERVAVSLPSTRVDALSPRILEEIRRVRKTGFTLAPEAGTQRLRDVIQKEYQEDELLAAARAFGELGWRSLKLYFMIGLPSETEEDVRGIAELAQRVRRAGNGRLKVTASVSTFSPKPHTPFQWAAQVDRDETLARQAFLRHELARRGIEFRWHDSRLSWLEGVFARGDRRLADVLETAQRLGARFDGWSDRCRIEVWEQALAEHGLDAAFYLRRRPLAEVLPWDHLDAGVSKKFLAAELARAVRGVLTPDCSIERCTYCGACDFRTVRNLDYHPEGAKGALHHGARISRWAELLVPDPEASEFPEWETRTWRRTRERVRRTKRQHPGTAVATDAPLPLPLERPATAVDVEGGEGNAEEWLGAVPSSLTSTPEPHRAVERVRVRYRKNGPARFIGTRELPTVFARAARRARVPVVFSNGHHPLPRLAFGPALPVGCSSDDEYVDVELTTPCTPGALVATLGPELPDGLELLGAEVVAPGTASIDASVVACVWSVDTSTLDEPPSAEALAGAAAAFAGAAALPVRKTVKGMARTIDARPLVRRLALVGNGTFELEIAAGPEGSVKPSAVIGELLALPETQRPLLRVHKMATRFRTADAPAAFHAA